MWVPDCSGGMLLQKMFKIRMLRLAENGFHTKFPDISTFPGFKVCWTPCVRHDLLRCCNFQPAFAAFDYDYKSFIFEQNHINCEAVVTRCLYVHGQYKFAYTAASGLMSHSAGYPTLTSFQGFSFSLPGPQFPGSNNNNKSKMRPSVFFLFIL